MAQSDQVKISNISAIVIKTCNAKYLQRKGLYSDL